MNDSRAFHLLFALALLAAILAPRPALGGSGLVKLTSCTTINKPGTYLLGVNLNRTGDCFKIQASPVVLDLGGLTITGKDGGAGITDNGFTLQGVVIRNGIITNFTEAIDLSNATSVHIEDVVMTEQTGRNVETGSGATIEDLTVVGGTDGIVTGDGSAVSACNVSGVSNDGIRVGEGSTVRGNTVSFAGSDGLQVDCPSTVVQNTSTGSGSNNILLNGAGCTSADNTAP